MDSLIDAALTILKKAWPYLLAAAIGASAAWWLQGLRVIAAKNDAQTVQNKFDQYKTDQQTLKNAAEERERKRAEETSSEYRKNVKKLEADVAAGNAFKRCVAAGKCGGLSGVPSSPGLRLPSASGVDAARTDAVPTAGGAAPQVVDDCAATTLQLNQLQSDIEKQGGR